MESEPRAEAREQQSVAEEAVAPAAEENPAVEVIEAEVTERGVPEAGGPEAGGPEAGAPEADAPQTDPAAEIAELQHAVHERTNDLKRLQAEYVNYKRRVDRDRDVARNGGIEAVIVDLMGVLDTLRIAQEHEQMTGGFKLLVDELEKITARYGLETFGGKGEVFDPQVHDALMQAPMPGVAQPTVLEVMQLGYRFKGRVLRPARVAVGMPTEDAPVDAEGGGGTSPVDSAGVGGTSPIDSAGGGGASSTE